MIEPLFKLSQVRLGFFCLLLFFSCAHEAWITMGPEGEPGTPLRVIGEVVDESSGEAIGRAFVELVQTDALGQYSDSLTVWDPRLKAHLRSTASGSFRMKTIRPGGYQDDEGKDVPAHIHFTVQAAGYRDYDGEFLFGDDPLVLRRGKAGVSGRGALIATVNEENGIAVARIVIPLQAISQP